MRLMTANLWNEQVDPLALEGVLDRYQPNLVAAQELDFDASGILTSRFDHGHVQPGGVAGCGLVADRPVDVEVVEIPFRPLLLAEVLIGDQPVTVGGVHIANPVAVNDLPHRRAQVRAIVEVIKGTEPFVLVGDFNSSPAWPAYRAIRRHLADGVADWAKRVGRRPLPTWTWGADSRKLLRIDHVMVRGVNVEHVDVVKVGGSDHRALVVDVAP